MEFESGNSQELVTDQCHTHNSAQSSYISFVSKWKIENKALSEKLKIRHRNKSGSSKPNPGQSSNSRLTTSPRKLVNLLLKIIIYCINDQSSITHDLSWKMWKEIHFNSNLCPMW